MRRRSQGATRRHHGPKAAVATAFIVLTCTCQAQFKSTVPLVVAPTTVTDSNALDVGE